MPYTGFLLRRDPLFIQLQPPCTKINVIQERCRLERAQNPPHHVYDPLSSGDNMAPQATVGCVILPNDLTVAIECTSMIWSSSIFTTTESFRRDSYGCTNGSFLILQEGSMTHPTSHSLLLSEGGNGWVNPSLFTAMNPPTVQRSWNSYL
ncbi:hypothetical protein GQ43DRAFT_442157 [Delitschia confertaspora ATCC 74209]|uniref:Uncharacterized protein n=1 Tax=Delitschia confertaspora ATCC 74209 TaxID=1513339 RepID=A0A9P4MU70_9PLEO|nr:hypothetical protein GQ43DRAFT_442157 [Delitschia confertaspora ATCC 74209]